MLTRTVMTLLAGTTALMMPGLAAADDFTAKQLTGAIQTQLEQNEKLGDVSVSLMGDYPQVLYHHEKPLTVSLHVDKLEVDRGIFSVTAELKEAANPDGPVVGKPFVVNGRFDEMVELPVAKRRIVGKEPVKIEDLTWASFPKRRLLRETLTSMEDVVGKAPKRSIPEGRPISNDDVMMPLIVRKNDPVTMIYESKMLHITANGTATQDGAVGDRIGIRNADSNTTIYGTITAPGTVSVRSREPVKMTDNNAATNAAGGNHAIR
ncbi:flagellar basal body P-ring formation protein FlgA [bacterium]|nr:flagellar basal body P-ring formation protein FlgA [bacterium]